MKHVSGFVEINTLYSNAPGVTSPLGELSRLGFTYSRNVGEYVHPEVLGYRLITLDVVNDSNAQQPLVASEVKSLLTVASFVGTYGATHTSPLSRQLFLSALNAQFVETAANFDFGPMVAVLGSLELPEWIAWEDLQYGMQVKLWFSNDAFLSQYTKYENIVTPPLENFDILNGVYSAAVLALSSESFAEFNQRVQRDQDSLPATQLKIYTLELQNIANPSQKTKTYWGVSSYGLAGTTEEAGKNSIIDYLEANSQNNLSAWQAHIPDLFKNNEFMIYPRWEHIAVHNLTTLSSLYSPMFRLDEVMAFAQAAATYYSSQHIATAVTVIQTEYKKLGLVVIDGENNITGSEHFATIYPDYFATSSLSAEYLRMDVDTRAFVTRLNETLAVAETATENTTLPVGMIRLIRAGQLFIGFVDQGRTFYIAAASNAIYGGN